MEKMKMEGWSEWSKLDTCKVEKTSYGFYDIVITHLDIQTALEDALFEIYLDFEDAKLISLEINDIIFVFDRFDDPQSPIFQVIGRKYNPISNLFLKTLQLGEISTEQWGNFPSLYNQLYPLVVSWMEILA